MKELQNNFTTPEQSKKLLELGVPADSSDMYYEQYSESVVYVGEVGDVPKGKTFYIDEPVLRHINPEGTWTCKNGERVDLSGKVDELRKTDIPCWTVGRLIEIFEICTGLVWENEVIDGYTKIDMLLEDFDDREDKYHFNFSKLDE